MLGQLSPHPSRWSLQAEEGDTGLQHLFRARQEIVISAFRIGAKLPHLTNPAHDFVPVFNLVQHRPFTCIVCILKSDDAGGIAYIFLIISGYPSDGSQEEGKRAVLW